MKGPRLTFRRLALIAIGVPLLAGLGWVADVFFVHDNFRAVGADLYRSGQLRADQWQDSFDKVHYRSVLNLQGAKPQTSWYKDELKFASDHGLVHYDYSLSAHLVPSVDEMTQIVDVMRTAPKPLLIHCKNGADRSGLVAALYRLAVEGQPGEVAHEQLSLWYGHFPWFGNRSNAMDVAFDRFNAAATAQAGVTPRMDKPL